MSHPPSQERRPTSSYLEDSDFGFQPRPAGPPSFHTSAPDASAHLPSTFHQPPSYDIPPAGSPPPPSDLYDPHHPSGQPSYPPSAGGSQAWAPSAYDGSDGRGPGGGGARPASMYSSGRELGPDDSMSVVGGGNHRPRESAGGLSYVDERGDYYRSQQWRPADGRGGEDEEQGGLVRGAAPMAREDSESDQNKKGMAQMGYADSPPVFLQDRSAPTPEKLTVFGKIKRSLAVGSGKFPKEQRIENKKRGLGRQKRPWASWILAAAMVCAMIFELVRNKQLTGSVIATKPVFNWMIGPSSATLVNVGARFVPCMKNVPDAPLTTRVGCFNETRTEIPTAETCPVADWCGLKVTDKPRQRYRFIVPVFLHAGLVHLALNLLVLLSVGAQVEKEMGSFFFLLIFFCGAIFGFELGGNFALPGVPSVGASGGIFAVNAVQLVDLLEHWQFEQRPKLKLGLLILELLLMIGLGYIPLLIDNFAHIGGLLIGLLLGVIIYPCISTTKRHRTIVWIFRGIAFVGLVMALVFVSINFFAEDAADACEWCRYLSCVPVKVTNFCKGTGLPVETTTSVRRKGPFDL